jgi:hypothetical protein
MMNMMMWWEPVCHKTELQQHCEPRHCSSALIISKQLSPHIRQVKCAEKDTDGQHNTLVVLAGFHTSQLDLNKVSTISYKRKFFYTII